MYHLKFMFPNLFNSQVSYWCLTCDSVDSILAIFTLNRSALIDTEATFDFNSFLDLEEFIFGGAK